MKNTKMLAMLLAGGQGSRLKALTRDIAKPAVSFGGKYRIIDFALSNAANSGIRDIAILTQYKPFELNTHLGEGDPWDFNLSDNGLTILSPFESEAGGRWFTGTANAIYENIDTIDMIDPEYVLILSGDHIYKMNYSKMLDFHVKNGSSVTIAAIEVPWEDAPRFGILNTDEDGRIVEFDEKPENPKNNLASMGIYIFNWYELRKALIEDEANPDSNNDFGMDVLPLMLEENLPIYAFPFEGYWKDVGTVRSYWEANLDLLDSENTLDVFDRSWRIYTNNPDLPPQYISAKAEITDSMVTEGCIVEGKVEESLLSSGVIVEEGAEVYRTVVLPNAVIKSGAKVHNSIVMEDAVVDADRIIGKRETDNQFVYLVAPEAVYEE